MTYTLGEVEHETEKAILAYIKFKEQGKTQITEEQLWIPKSVIERNGEIKSWYIMAKKKEGKLEWVSLEDFAPKPKSKSNFKPNESQSERARRLNPDLNYGSAFSDTDVDEQWVLEENEDEQEDF